MFVKDSILAIDLSRDAVRVLDVRQKKSGPRVQAFATQTVEAGTNETLPDRHLRALGSLIDTHRLKSKRCVSALPTSLVISRSVAIDPSKPQSPEEQIRWTLQNCLPFDPKDLAFDFWPVGEPKPNARTRDVLVVAVQASVVQRYLQGFEKLGLTCEHLDVAPCAVASLLIRQSSFAEGTICTVAIAENTGYFAVVENKQLLFWRPFEISNAAQKYSSSGLDRVGDEISKCVSHMVGTMQLDNLSELLLFGNGAEDEKFAEYLTSRFHIPVRAPSPFDALTADSMAPEVRAAVQPNVATHFAAAVGLALQPQGVSIHG
ncbi:MAG TPA: pilus assembly protein PilM [Phycisphaerae bacterium]|nr:pilus assembly protein PilM [Phycisphaerae bacterium]